MRALGFTARFFAISLIVAWFIVVYGVRRIATLFARGVEGRRRAVAHLRGSVVRRAMTRLGATFVKLGQVMSTRPDLFEPETIDELRILQDRLPAFPMTHVRAVLEGDLGADAFARFSEFDVLPVAAASVSQVHRARLENGREVAVKVTRPDVRAKVERDGAILAVFARIAALHPGIRLSDPVGHLAELIQGILDQTDLRIEARNYERFRKHFATTEGVYFPEVFADLSGERVMTMEFLRGHKLDALPPGDHRDVAKRLQRVFLKMCFVDGLVHADLHPGNLLLLENGDLAIFDVGLVKDMSRDVLLQFADFTKCLVMGTANDFVLHLKRFHSYQSNVDWPAFEKDVEAFIAVFRSQSVAELELGEMTNHLFALARRFRVRPLPEFALVIVAMVTAEGIGKQLNPDTNLFEDTAAFLLPLLVEHGLGLPGAA
jgi:ubiquinone biosynthesis protein